MFLINITSFSIGILAVTFMYLFVIKEFRSDEFHAKHKDIYRVLQSRQNAPTKMSWTSFPLGNLLKSNYGQIQKFTRYIEHSANTININKSQFLNQSVSYVDKSFFEIFDFTLKVGDYNQLFKVPNSVIIDKKTAIKYFNTTDVLGKVMEIEADGENPKTLLSIVGILSNYPEESTLQPKIITDIKSKEKGHINDYWMSSPQLFLYIPNCNNSESLSREFAQTYYSRLNELRSKQYKIDQNRLTLQKLSDMYLHSSNVEDAFPKGDPVLLWVLIGIGFVLLIITFINSIIFSLGMRLKNQKQDQIHRVLGGSSFWLKKKYSSESVFYSIIAFIVALMLLPIAHKVIISFTNYRYFLFSKLDIQILFSFLLGIILLGIISGFIQYYVLRNYKRSDIERINIGNKQTFFKYLIQVQLSVFIIVVISLVIVIKQIRFISTQDLGYDVENTITVTMNGDDNKKLFIQEFKNHASVENISVGHTLFKTTPYLNDIVIKETQTKVKAQCIWGDHNYINTYKIKLLSGKNINKEKIPPIDRSNTYKNENTILDILVNQEFIQKSGLKNPLGTIVSINHNGKDNGRIVGIIENVKNLPFYAPTTPIVIAYGLSYGSSIIVSVNKGSVDDFKYEVEKFFVKIHKEHYSACRTERYDFEKWYSKEQTFMYLMSIFSVIILFILVLGLTGLSLHISESKTKEIGIRKVNGAKVSEILSMLNKDFIKWVIIAFVIATPIAYYTMSLWLENFAYKTALSWWIFALAGVLALGIALLTVSWQSWRAATRNPVEALRYE